MNETKLTWGGVFRRIKGKLTTNKTITTTGEYIADAAIIKMLDEKIDAIVPIGTIISLMGTTAPTGYLKCDGNTYNISDYSELADYFNEQFGSKNYFGGDGSATFKVPDLRGEFLRGAGTNGHTNQGSGGTVGQHQDGTIHDFYYNNTSSVYGGGITNSTRDTADKLQNSWTNSWHPQSGSVASGASGGRGTSRPTNTSVLYCIKYK